MAPANGAIQGVVDPYLPTNEIKFVCDEGYRLVGEEIDTCQRNGVWDVNKTPSCKISKSIVDGIHELTKHTQFVPNGGVGSHATFGIMLYIHAFSVLFESNIEKQTATIQLKGTTQGYDSKRRPASDSCLLRRASNI